MRVVFSIADERMDLVMYVRGMCVVRAAFEGTEISLAIPGLEQTCCCIGVDSGFGRLFVRTVRWTMAHEGTTLMMATATMTVDPMVRNEEMSSQHAGKVLYFIKVLEVTSCCGRQPPGMPLGGRGLSRGGILLLLGDPHLR